MAFSLRENEAVRFVLKCMNNIAAFSFLKNAAICSVRVQRCSACVQHVLTTWLHATEAHMRYIIPNQSPKILSSSPKSTDRRPDTTLPNPTPKVTIIIHRPTLDTPLTKGDCGTVKRK